VLEYHKELEGRQSMYEQNNNLKKELIKLLKMREDALEFTLKLSESGELLFFGGSVRDLYLDEINEYPRDFDIAIIYHNKYLFNELLDQYEYKLNRFGGYKFYISGTEFDVWDLNNTWAFKNKYLIASEENLVDSVFLSVDGIAYNFNKSILYNSRLDESLRRNEIDIVLDSNPQIELNLLRALILKKKYNLELSLKLKELLKNYYYEMNNEFLEILHQLQMSHYKIEKISKSDIESEIMCVV